jgi:hypothetical protein
MMCGKMPRPMTDSKNAHNQVHKWTVASAKLKTHFLNISFKTWTIERDVIYHFVNCSPGPNKDHHLLLIDYYASADSKYFSILTPM